MSATVADFTLSDFHRAPAKVLEACDRAGLVRIRNRKGQVYEMRPSQETATAPAAKPGYPDFAARRRALGMPMMTREQREMLDKLIAGE